MPGWIDGYRMMEMAPLLPFVLKRPALFEKLKNAESEARWDLILRRQKEGELNPSK